MPDPGPRAVVVYRGPLERSRLRTLLEPLAGDDLAITASLPGFGDAAEARSFLTRFAASGRITVGTGRLPEWRVIRTALRSARSADLVLVIGAAYPLIPLLKVISGGAVCWSINGIPDEALLHSDTRLTRVRVRVEKLLMAVLARPADRVVAVSHRMARYLRDDVHLRVPVEVVPIVSDASIFTTWTHQDRDPVIVYAGTGAPWQHLDVAFGLVAAAQRRLPELRLELITRDPRVERAATAAGCTNVRMRGSDDPAEVARWLSEARLGLVVRDDHVVNRVAYPTKVSEYLMTGVEPVTFRIDWDAGDLLAATGTGVMLDASASTEDNGAALAEALRAWTPAAASRARDAARAHLDQTEWQKELTRVYEELMDDDRSSGGESQGGPRTSSGRTGGRPPTRRFRARPSAVTTVLSTTWSHPANHGHRLRAVARLARTEVTARATGRPVEVRLGRHSRVRAHLHTGGSWRVAQANPPDFEEQSLWARILRPGDLFVDVGANAGVYTIWALDLGARVVAVEPDGGMIRQLRDNLVLNGYEAEALACALSNEPGHATFGGPDLLRQRLQPTGEGSGGREVEVRTLDGVLGGRRARGVKIDVEGYERLVLEGARTALADQAIDVLQLEWNDTVESALDETRRPTAAMLHEAGYVLFRPTRRGSLTELTEPDYGADVFAATPEVFRELQSGSR